MDAEQMFQPGVIADASPGFGTWMRRHGAAPAFASFRDGRLGMIEAAGPRGAGLALREQVVPGLAMLQAAGRSALFCLAAGALVRLHRSPGRETGLALRSEVVRQLGDGAARVLAIRPDGQLVTADARGRLSASLPDGSSDGIGQPRASLGDLTLTGVALDDDGSPVYATAWRERAERREGLVLDLRSGEVAVSNLGAACSPRLENGWLWFLDRDRGALCVSDPESGLSETVARCPGRPGGLAMAGDHAVVGISPSSSFPRARQRDVPESFRGLLVLDTHEGRVVEWLALGGFEGSIDDVALIAAQRHARAAGVARPSANDDCFTSA